MISYFPISRSVGVGLMLSEGSNPDRALITKNIHILQQVGGSKPSIAARLQCSSGVRAVSVTVLCEGGRVVETTNTT